MEIDQDKIGDGDTLLKQIADRGLVIFGTGYLAKIWMKILQERGLTGAVRYFVVSRKRRDGAFFGCPVYTLDEAPFRQDQEESAQVLLGLAVHEAIKEEVMPELRQRYKGDILFLYPWMHELLFRGILREESVSLDALLAAQPKDNYWITVRYAALCEYMCDMEENRHTAYFLQKRNRMDSSISAADLYIKTQALFSERCTAERRLKRFYEFAHLSARDAILREQSILVDEDYRIIDGLHRIALSRFLERDQIRCRVVRVSERYDEMFPEENRVTLRAQKRAGLSTEEQHLLHSMKEEMLYGTPK